MPRPRQVQPNELALRLQAFGPQTAQVLASGLRVDRSNISRAFALPGLARQVIRLGTTRGTSYALRRPVRGLGDTFPIRRIDAKGRARDWAELTALHGGWRVVWAEPSRAPAWADRVLALGGFDEGFPFYLGELRPQGYLGRAVGRALPAGLGLPRDPRDWSDDDTLVYLFSEGDELPGDLVVGDGPLARYQRSRLAPPAGVIAEADRAERYPALAAAVALPVGGASSVEGEQPKFLVTLSPGNAELQLVPSPQVSGLIPQPSPPRPPLIPVLVKFTDRLSTPTGRRWADLLIAEAVAQSILHARGEAHAAPRLVHAGDRLFLETPRYDRVGAHGRRGVISLRAFHDAYPGPSTHDWTVAAVALAAGGLIDAAALRSIRLRHAFGRLIGNTDMHFGNLAFWFDDALPFRLAPAYDMLPMLWAPVAGEATPAPEFAPALPLPAEREIWHEAAAWADEFWRRVAANPLVTPAFAAIAARAGETLARLRSLA
jgi:hypothetical protein